MKKLAICFFFTAVFILSACDSKQSQQNSQQSSGEPKTFYGKAIKQTKDLQKDSAKRAKEIDEQAKQVSDE